MTSTNYGPIWQRARGQLWPDGHPLASATVYELRHAAATMMLRASVPPAEVARRLGHSVDVLMRVYAGAFEDERERSNELIDAASVTANRSGAGVSKIVEVASAIAIAIAICDERRPTNPGDGAPCRRPHPADTAQLICPSALLDIGAIGYFGADDPTGADGSGLTGPRWRMNSSGHRTVGLSGCRTPHRSWDRR